MYTLGNVGVRRVQDASAKRMEEGEKLRGKPLPNNVRFCEHY